MDTWDREVFYLLTCEMEIVIPSRAVRIKDLTGVRCGASAAVLDQGDNRL